MYNTTIHKTVLINCNMINILNRNMYNYFIQYKKTNIVKLLYIFSNIN